MYVMSFIIAQTSYGCQTWLKSNARTCGSNLSYICYFSFWPISDVNCDSQPAMICTICSYCVTSARGRYVCHSLLPKPVEDFKRDSSLMARTLWKQSVILTSLFYLVYLFEESLFDLFHMHTRDSQHAKFVSDICSHCVTYPSKTAYEFLSLSHLDCFAYLEKN
jgi:hypothetical protein